MTGILAIIVSLLWWRGFDLSLLVARPDTWFRAPWTLITSALPHVDPFHLLFNLAWLWYFGTRIEAELPRDVFPLICLYAAVGSAAQCAFLRSGVGLSGVGYGFFGMCWVLSAYDERFSGLVDRRIRNLFIIWFLLCVALTVTDLWRVGNYAHAAGGIVGLLVGGSCVRRGPLLALVATGFVVCLLVAAFVVPIVARSG